MNECAHSLRPNSRQIRKNVKVQKLHHLAGVLGSFGFLSFTLLGGQLAPLRTSVLRPRACFARLCAIRFLVLS